MKKKIYAVMRKSYDCNYSTFASVVRLCESKRDANKYAKECNEDVEDEFGDGLLDSYFVEETELYLKQGVTK